MAYILCLSDLDSLNLNLNLDNKRLSTNFVCAQICSNYEQAKC